MKDSIADSIKEAAHNEVLVEAGATKDEGAGIKGIIEREKGSISYGAEGGISQKKGWSVKGFFKKVWG